MIQQHQYCIIKAPRSFIEMKDLSYNIVLLSIDLSWDCRWKHTDSQLVWCNTYFLFFPPNVFAHGYWHKQIHKTKHIWTGTSAELSIRINGEGSRLTQNGSRLLQYDRAVRISHSTQLSILVWQEQILFDTNNRHGRNQEDLAERARTIRGRHLASVPFKWLWGI